MTQDEIYEMAHQAGVKNEFNYDFRLSIEAFAKLVADKATEEANARANASWTLMCEKMVAFEREACAKVANQISDKYGYGYYGNEVDTADEIAAAIRARGEA